MKIKEIMHTGVKSCSPESALDAVALEMWNNDCGVVPIIDDEGKPVGIVTDRDIAIGGAIQHKPLWEIKSKDITRNRQLFMCKTDDDISAALELMKQNQVRRLPVVDEHGRLAGILSLCDVFTHTDSAKGHGRKAQISDDMALATMRAVVSH